MSALDVQAQRLLAQSRPCQSSCESFIWTLIILCASQSVILSSISTCDGHWLLAEDCQFGLWHFCMTSNQTALHCLNCSEIFNDGFKQSGFYKIKPLQSPAEFSVYCDMSDGGGWTVIQRRSDGSENFNRNWNDYENGFGNFVQKNGEYWLGNRNLHVLTTQGDYTLKIDLADFEKNNRYAQYKNFKVGDEKNSYDLHIGEYSGTAGDSLAGNFHPEVQWWGSHQRMKFSTWDRDNDNYEGNCAKEDLSGWWFNRCHSANLNGLYHSGPYTAKTDNGIVWHTWHGWWYSLKSVVMKIRPNDFIPNIV